MSQTPSPMQQGPPQTPAAPAAPGIGRRSASPSPALTAGLLSPGSPDSTSQEKDTARRLQLPPRPASSDPFSGGNKNKVKYNGGNYKVHTGPRGGLYIMVKQQKVYLNKKN